jgi:hypothetical protein
MKRSGHEKASLAKASRILSARLAEREAHKVDRLENGLLNMETTPKHLVEVYVA